jgi:hypothetical protein
MRQRDFLNASLNIGLSATVSARALKVATFISFSGFDHQLGTRPTLSCSWSNQLTPEFSKTAKHCEHETTVKRRALNDFIRTSELFDGVIDFDKATLDPASGGLKPEFVPESTTGGPGDKLHPNRTGYLAMGMAIDLDLFESKLQAKR